MKFIRSILAIAVSLLFSGGGSAASGVETFDDFLSEQEIREDFGGEIANVARRLGMSYGRGIADIPASFVKRILMVSGEVQESDLILDHSLLTKQRIQVTKIFEGETPLHQDHYQAQDKEVVDGKVGFIALNDNPTAVFHHGDTKIPLKRGSLIVFDGAVPHQTIVGKGVVDLAGPFRLRVSLDRVGLACDLCCCEVECTGCDVTGWEPECCFDTFPTPTPTPFQRQCLEKGTGIRVCTRDDDCFEDSFCDFTPVAVTDSNSKKSSKKSSKKKSDEAGGQDVGICSLCFLDCSECSTSDFGGFCIGDPCCEKNSKGESVESRCSCKDYVDTGKYPTCDSGPDCPGETSGQVGCCDENNILQLCPSGTF